MDKKLVLLEIGRGLEKPGRVLFFATEKTMNRTKLTRREITAAFDSEEMTDRFPPIMTLTQVAQLCQCSMSTVEKWSSQGKLDFAKSNRGPVRFWRDRVVVWCFGDRGN